MTILLKSTGLFAGIGLASEAVARDLKFLSDAPNTSVKSIGGPGARWLASRKDIVISTVVRRSDQIFLGELRMLRAFAILCVAASPAAAQIDFSSMNSSIAANNLTTSQWMTNEILNREIVPSVAGKPRRAPPRSAESLASPIRAALASSDVKTQQAKSTKYFRYTRSEDVSQAVRRNLIARIGQYNSAAGKQVAEQLAKHDALSVYADLVSPFGLRRGDVADSMAAYTLLCWGIANNILESDPNGRHRAAAIRSRIAEELAASSQLVGNSDRQKIDEELVYLFVITHAGWQAAVKSNDLESYSEAIRQTFQKQFGRDLRSLTLTNTGFRTR